MTANTPLNGQRAIVTGAAVGLGRAYAIALADHGVKVAVCDVREEVEALAAEYDGAGEIRAWRADVSDPADVRRVVDGAVEAFGGVDILINNAGIWGGSQADDNLDKSIDDFSTIMGTNLAGEFFFGRAVIPIMIEQGTPANIVNVATDHMVTCGTPHYVCKDNPNCPWCSPGGTFDGQPRPTGGGDGMDLYDASKWALNGLLYAWAKALKPHRIRVNSLCMGATDSYMLRSFHKFDPAPEEVAQWMRAEDSAQVLVDLLLEGPDGRTADSMNFCVGRKVQLEPPNDPLYIPAEAIQ